MTLPELPAAAGDDWTRYLRHELSAVWGDMPPDEYRELVASIAQDALAVTVRLLDGRVLDGWHRYRACIDAGVKPQLAAFSGDDPAGFVIRQNGLRRHLTPGDRAKAVLQCREWQPATGGRPRKTGSNDPVSAAPATNAQLAAEIGISEPTVKRAKAKLRREQRIEEAGLSEHVEAGTLTDDEADAIVEAGLDTTVRAGTLAPKAAAEAARADLADQPKSPTRVERLEAERDALRLEVHENVERIADLDDQVRFHEGNLSEHEHERHKAYTALQAENRTLRSQNNEWITRYNDELRSRKYWERWARDHGWTTEEVKA